MKLKERLDLLKNKLKTWWKYDSIFSETWNEYNNPFYHWWKVRKYFKFPNVHLLTGKHLWFYGMPIREDYWNRFIDIRISALGWKDKFSSPRHEWNPYICLSLFRYKILLMFDYNDGTEYGMTENISIWEIILYMLYYNKELNKDLIEDHIWYAYKDEKKIPIVGAPKYLTKQYSYISKDIDTTNLYD